jgi:hypothetical protein
MWASSSTKEQAEWKLQRAPREEEAENREAGVAVSRGGRGSRSSHQGALALMSWLAVLLRMFPEAF